VRLLRAQWLRSGSLERDVVRALQVPEGTPENVDTAIEEARRAGLLIDGLRSGTYRFSHAIFRDALYEQLSAPQRSQLHRRIGEAFEARADRDEHLSELARHFVLASRNNGDLAKGVEYARRAGRRALEVLAYEEGVRLLELALGALKELGPEADRDRCAILVDLGIARRASGDGETSKANLLRAAEIARRLNLSDELVRAALGGVSRGPPQPQAP
jgi:predicted ATPase